MRRPRRTWLRAPEPDPSALMWLGAVASFAGWIDPAYILLAQLLALAALADAASQMDVDS